MFFPAECLLLVKDFSVGKRSAAKVKHYIGCPPSCSMSLNVIPNFVCDVLQVLGKPRNALSICGEREDAYRTFGDN